MLAVPKSTQFTDPTGTEVQLDTLAQQLRRGTCQRRACGIGAKGFRVYDWALVNAAEADPST